MDPNQFEKRIQSLEKWQQERIQQQITYPLDVNSQIVLGKYFMHIVSQLTTIAGAAGNEFTNFIGKQGIYEFIVTQNDLIPYTVDTTTNIFSTPSAYFENDMRVNVSTTDTAPSPLLAGVDYFVVNSLGITFQVSATVGGAAIDITTAGVGSQFITSLGF